MLDQSRTLLDLTHLNRSFLVLSPKFKVVYYGRKVVLRGLELSDVDSIMKGWNNLEMRRYLGIPTPNSKEEEIEWIRKGWSERQKGISHTFAIDTLNGDFLGTISLFSVKRINQSAILGVTILDANNRGKGFGTDAVITVCAFGFLVLNLRRIQLSYFEGNEAGVKVYLKAGFKEVGRLRQSNYSLGEYQDEIIMDVLRQEFMELHSDYNLFSTA